MKYKAIIFDLDGVLVHTDKYHYQAWKVIADKAKIPFDETVNNRLRGVSRMESLDIILSYSDRRFSEDEKIAMSEEKNEHYKTLLKNLLPQSVSAETVKTLDELHTMGLRLAIGSSSKNANYILQKTEISHFFDAVVSGLDITKTKPSPEVFLKAAERLNMAPKDCLVVEDAHAGVEAAVAGGFDCAGMGDAYSSDLVTYQINNISELCSILKLL
ncbi:MAG: beta-phosphoglucomutase [Defluviitaleaceae bacterium]|nr:beta-phosphoglucomutase [Defluviitaleaceae bacterium]